MRTSLEAILKLKSKATNEISEKKVKSEMRRKSMIKKFAAITLSIMLVVMCLSACGGGSSAGITKPALISSAKIYEPDYANNGKGWVLSSSHQYEYENAYPVSEKRKDGDSEGNIKYNYEFKGDKPVNMKYTSPFEGGPVEVIYTDDGVVDRILGYDSTGRKISEKIFQYGNRDEFFTFVLQESIVSSPKDKIADHMDETDSVIVTTANGLLKKTVNDGLFANYNDKEVKEWKRFDGSYTAFYDDNGIVSETEALFTTFPGSGKQNKFELTITDGRVVEAIRYVWSVPQDEGAAEDAGTAPEEGGESTGSDTAGESADSGSTDQGSESTNTDSSDEGVWEPEKKFEFEYTDIEISPARYSSMINYHLLEGGGNYYIFNWY